MENLSGQVLKGYELHDLIGKGGLGAVYRALQPQVGREVAIKIILPQFANHPDFIRRFEFEAQLVARLEHPHIVPLYDFWREPDGAYLVMRLLRRSVRESLNNGGPWPLENAVYLLDQIAAALTVAHRNGVIHRDLKPDNILLDEDGNAYLADFGIAKDLQLDGDTADDDEETDTVVGSPAYLSPEQIKSDPVMPQTDLYGLGIVLYELITGNHPFGSVQSTDMLYKHLNDPLPPLQSTNPDFSPEIDEVLRRATSKDPATRYSSALSMAAAFRQVVTMGSPTSPPGDTAITRGFAASILEDRTPSGSVDAPEPENPYKGLRPFGEADANHFFGREMLTIQLLSRLSEADEFTRFLAVVGPSGSGKTSVVRAGLIPALRIGALPGSQDWFTLDMLPGSHPISQLETLLQSVAVTSIPNLNRALREDKACLSSIIREALPSGGEEHQLVLMIDQFETLFTDVEDESERTTFLRALHAAVTAPESCLYVIVTLRADYYDRPLSYPAFGEMMRRRTEVVLPLAGEDLERAIVGPAESVQVGLEPGLVEMIKADLGMQPGALPLLQYALTELFEQREGRQLTRAAYQSIGGVMGALALRAEELYSELDADGREAARQLFLRLSSVGESTQGARRRVPQEELATLGGNPDAIEHVLEQYGKSRLLTFDRDPATRLPTVEVAHEALLWEWGRLQGWIDASREDVHRQRRMREAVADWLAAERDASYLAAGRRLEELETWATRTDLALNRQEEAYLYASMAQREAQLAEEEARQTREARLRQRNQRILKVLFAVLVVATFGALALSAFAFRARHVAQNERDNAHHAMSTAEAAHAISMTNEAIAARNEAEARSLALAAAAQLALNQNDTALAINLGLLANDIPDPPSQAQHVLAQAAYRPAIRQRLAGHADDVTSAAFGPEGKTALSGSADTSLILWDLETGAIVRRMEEHTAGVWDVATSPDGTQGLSGAEDGTVFLWDLETGAIVHSLEGHKAAVQAVAFVPTALEIEGTAYARGQLGLTGGLDHTLILWDLATGKIVRRMEGHQKGIYDVAVSSHGEAALTGSADGSAILWDLVGGEVLYRLGEYNTAIVSVALSADGVTAATGAYGDDIVLWDLATGREIKHMPLHESPASGLAFTPDGRRLLSGAEGMVLWDIESGRLLHRFGGGPGGAVSIAPDGQTALSAGDDLLFWDIASGAEIRHLVTPEHINTVALKPASDESRHAIFGTDSGGLYLWEMGSQAPPRLLVEEETAINSVAFGPQGHSVLYGTDGGDAALWDVMSHTVRLRLEGHQSKVRNVAFGPEGKTMLSGAADGTVIFWDLETGTIIHRMQEHTGDVWSVAVTSDGQMAVSGGSDGLVILWDLLTGTPIGKLAGHESLVHSVATSPDGQTAVSGSFDGTLILWSLETCAPVRRFLGHGASISTVAFSPTGKMIASGDMDGTLVLWDVGSGQPIRQLTGHVGEVRGVAFSQDGHTLLSGALDGTLRQWWAHSVDEMAAWTREHRSLYIRELNCFERERYGLEPCPPGTLPAHSP